MLSILLLVTACGGSIVAKDIDVLAVSKKLNTNERAALVKALPDQLQLMQWILESKTLMGERAVLIGDAEKVLMKAKSENDCLALSGSAFVTLKKKVPLRILKTACRLELLKKQIPILE